MDKPERTYRILIADDQPLTREGLKLILESEADFTVVGEARNGLEAVELAKALAPDLVLLDVRMPIMDGIESLRLIKAERPQTTAMILTTFAEDEYIVEGLAGGAAGYLLKDMERERLVASIRDAAAGQFVLQGIIAERLAHRLLSSGRERAVPSSDSLPVPPRLTDREEEVARLLVRGFGNREIGLHMQLSDGTVRNYISVLYGKLGVSSRAKAIILLQKLVD
jgi:DNA-binding NarL/FixJ family response regulator